MASESQPSTPLWGWLVEILAAIHHVPGIGEAGVEAPPTLECVGMVPVGGVKRVSTPPAEQLVVVADGAWRRRESRPWPCRTWCRSALTWVKPVARTTTYTGRMATVFQEE